jgi:prepilin-type N-terminal cleavage/methylation domain-containing protein
LWNSGRGFTLLEILITLAIVGAGILVLAKMQVLTVRGTGFNKEATAAMLLAQRTMEDCRTADFSTKPTSCDKDEEGMNVACEMKITGDAPYRCNNITVRVTWGVTRNQVSLSTAVAER